MHTLRATPLQVGVYGQEVTEQECPTLLTMLTAHPVLNGGLVDVEGGGVAGGVADSVGLTLADCIAPHWFVPPEGK